MSDTIMSSQALLCQVTEVNVKSDMVISACHVRHYHVKPGTVVSGHVRPQRLMSGQTWLFQVVMSDTIMSSQALLCHIMSGHTG